MQLTHKWERSKATERITTNLEEQNKCLFSAQAIYNDDAANTTAISCIHTQSPIETRDAFDMETVSSWSSSLMQSTDCSPCKTYVDTATCVIDSKENDKDCNDNKSFNNLSSSSHSSKKCHCNTEKEQHVTEDEIGIIPLNCTTVVKRTKTEANDAHNVWLDMLQKVQVKLDKLHTAAKQ